jgi:aspartyl-tRNA(Asn)/glutamyl-tRNA(Gln) amidotransferase subunit C
MSIDTDTARRVAKLARIAVPEENLPKLAEDLSGILDFMEQLNEVDVDGIEPMTSVTPMRLPRRKDVVTDGNQQAAVLANAPDSREGFFAVPKVVE